MFLCIHSKISVSQSRYNLKLIGNFFNPTRYHPLKKKKKRKKKFSLKFLSCVRHACLQVQRCRHPFCGTHYL